jgi:tRNA U34 5-methylaminomethyl-2-thiouridine-forming methyltransferase MnmC
VSFNTGYKLVKLACGVHSVHSVSERETFHPVIGPAAEAEALYVKQLRLVERLRTHVQQWHEEFVIWDVGLGAAANALVVLRALSAVPARIRLVSFDHTLEPLRFALGHAATLGYFNGYEAIANRLAQTEEHSLTFPNGDQTVHWQAHLGDFPTLLLHASARELPKPHVILFDAYSPAKNPAMWTLPLFENVFRLLDPVRPCALPTYSRSTLLRVTLLLAGFFVGAGHATGEKEETTIAANAPELVSEPLDLKWLDRARRSHSAEPLHEPVYRQAPLTPEALEKLQAHPQFHST